MTTANRHVLRTAIVIAMLLPALLLGPAADANSVSKRDPRGDAAKAIDFVRWKAKNGKKAIVVTVRFRSVRFRKLQGVGVAALPKGKTQRTGFIFGFRRAKKGGTFKRFSYRALKPIKCKKMRFRHRRDVARVKIPQKCLGKAAGRLRFDLSTTGYGSTRADDAKGRTKLIKRG